MANPEHERVILRRRLLGWSLAASELAPGEDHGRDLVLAINDDGRRDLARVEQVDALAQSLEIALTTALGSDVFNTDFGFDGLRAIAEESSPLLVRERVRVSVIQVLQKDPRVRRILDVKIAGGQLEPVRDPRTLDVRVDFETVSGEQASAELGKVVPSG